VTYYLDGPTDTEVAGALADAYAASADFMVTTYGARPDPDADRSPETPQGGTIAPSQK
jgi:hypothetical protein